MFRKINYGLLTLLAIIPFVYFRWFVFSPSAGGDWHYYNPNALRDSFLHSTWVSSYILGGVDLLIWRFPIDSMKSLIGFLGFDSSISDRLVVFWPSLILANISSYMLIRKITKSNLASVVGAIIYNFNTYFLTANSAYLIYGATSWVIFSLLSFIKSLEERRSDFAVLSGLLLFVAASHDFRIAYIGAFIIFFYFIFYVLTTSVHFKEVFLRFASTLSVFIFLSSFWILPMLTSGSLTANAVLSRSLFGNDFLNILYAIAFNHPFWTGAQPVYFHIQQINWYFWLIPIFAFLGLYLSRKNKNILFFGGIALLGIFLTKQVGDPFSGIYYWLFQYFPGFSAFREASKFYFLIALGYSVLVAGFVSWIWSKKRANTIPRYVRLSLTAVILFIFLWNAKPLITGEIQGIYVNRSIPDGYNFISNLLLKDADYSRTLWVPNDPGWFYFANDKPLIGFQNILNTNWEKLTKKGVKETQGEIMMNFMNEDFADNILDLSAIRYVVIPSEDSEDDINTFQFFGESRNYYVSKLRKINYLKELKTGMQNFTVYENYNYRPHIYTTFEKETIYKNTPYAKIEFQFINTTEYKIYLKNVKKPLYVNFSEIYHPNWKLRIGKFSWFGTLIDKKYFISDKYHMQNNAGLSSFYIDPRIVCKDYPCSKNSDGSYNMNLTLYFAPQSYMYLGLIISGATLILIFIYLYYCTFTKTHEKKV